MRPAIGHTARCAEPGVVIQPGRVHPVEVEWLLERFPKSSHRVGTDVVTQSVARLNAVEQKSPRAHSVKLNTGVTKAVVPGFPAGRPFAGRHQFDVGRRGTACCAERRGDQVSGHRWSPWASSCQQHGSARGVVAVTERPHWPQPRSP